MAEFSARFFRRIIVEYGAAEFSNPRRKRVEVVSERDRLSISSASWGRRISAEVVSPSCSRRSIFMPVVSIRWLEKPPDPLAVHTPKPKIKVVPALIAGTLNSKDAIEFLGCSLARPPTWHASCRCFTGKLSEVYPEEIDCRQGLAEIRT